MAKIGFESSCENFIGKEFRFIPFSDIIGTRCNLEHNKGGAVAPGIDLILKNHQTYRIKAKKVIGFSDSTARLSADQIIKRIK